MRTEKVIKNGIWGSIYQLVKIILGFIGRTVFIKYLGAEYVGVSGLFTNILTILSMTELGLSSAVAFHLYKFLAVNDQKQIIGIINFYKKIYRIIAACILFLGILIIPFLTYIVGETLFSQNYITLVFLIYLVKTSTSYLFSYTYILATADQKGYILSRVDIVMHFIISITNIFILIIFKNFIIYLIVEILIDLIGRYIKAQKVKKVYPYIKENIQIDIKTKNKIIYDVKNIFASKVATTVVTSTDNILISFFFGVSMVGYYSNYSLIIGYVQTFLTQFTSATQSSLGNMFILESKEHSYETLKKLTVILYFVTSSCSVCLFVLINPFMNVWIGKPEYILDMIVVSICILNFYIQIMKTPLWYSVSGIGYFKQDKKIAIYGAISNLFVSIVGVQLFGIVGVFIGTAFSQSTQWIMKTNLFVSDYLELKKDEYVILSLKLLALTCSMCIGTNILCQYILLDNIYACFTIKLGICVILPILLNVILFHSTDEFKYLKNMLIKMYSAISKK